jgi:hypothetical protein|tara:strand:- start:123 stop:338 length:216 start_codon:yes stop_codon:yes gene_type:complete
MSENKRFIMYAVRSDYGADSKVLIDSFNLMSDAIVNENKIPESYDVVLYDTKHKCNYLYFDEWVYDEEIYV